PREICVGLGEAETRQVFHHSWSRECLRQEDRVWRFLSDTSKEPLPECERLRMRVVDAEDLHALVDPEQDDVEERRPQLAPISRFEVKGIYVLVALRGILGIADPSVWSMPEPGWVLADPRMVGCGLECEVDGHVDPPRRGLLQQ